jgi:hypothetical protein
MKRLFLSTFPSLGRPGAGLFVLCTLTLVSSSLAQDSTHSSGWIVIPATEYGELRVRAYPVAHDTTPVPAVSATLTRVDYDLRIHDALASGRANLTVDVLKDGWVGVPIPKGLMIRDARLDGKALSLIPGFQGTNQLTAMLGKRGRSVLALDVALPVESAGGVEKLSLPPSSSGVTRASVALTGQDMDIRVTGGVLAEKAESHAENKWLAYGGGADPLVFSWRRKLEEHKVELPLRTRGSLTQLLGLGEDTTSVYTEVSVEVVQGSAQQIRIAVPDNVTVNQVSGATVGDWDTRPGELTVKFLEPVTSSARFVVTGDTRLPHDGSISVPLLRLLDVERDSGGVAVEVLGAGEIRDLKSQGLENADAAELGATVGSRQSPSLAAFRFRPGSDAAARSLTVQLARYQQQAVLTANIEEARYRVLIARQGKTLVQARFAVRNNQKDFLLIALPAGATLWSASVAGHPVRPGRAPDGGLLLPLNKARSGEEAAPFAVEVLYFASAARWEEKAKTALALPSVDLPVSRTGLVLYYPPSYRVTPEAGTFTAQPYASPASVALTTEATVEAPLNVSLSGNQRDPMERLNSNAAQSAAQALVDQFNSRAAARKPAQAFPTGIEFPAVGPSMFLVSELTSENQAPKVELNYQHEGKGGVK